MLRNDLFTCGALVALTTLAGCDSGNAIRQSASGNDSPTTVAGRAAPTVSPALDTAGRAEIRRSVLEVTADVNKIQMASAAEQEELLPAHIQTIEHLLGRFESKVRAMHVEQDQDWVAVIDSVRTDLARMPDMPPEELHAYMPGHNRRVMRIVACVDMVSM